VEEPDLPSEQVIEAFLRVHALDHAVHGRPERARQIADRRRELIDGGLSVQEAGLAVWREVEEVINPEVEAEKLERLRMIHDPRTRDSIEPRGPIEEAAMTEERVLLIRDPATRDSIVPRNERERDVMKTELMAAENARMAAENARVAEETARMAEETQRLVGMAEKKMTAGIGPAAKSASGFFAKTWGAIVAAAVAVATFFCFLGWRLGLCSRYGEKASEEAQK
jgi:hypothetical protein